MEIHLNRTVVEQTRPVQIMLESIDPQEEASLEPRGTTIEVEYCMKHKVNDLSSGSLTSLVLEAMGKEMWMKLQSTCRTGS